MPPILRHRPSSLPAACPPASARSSTPRHRHSPRQPSHRRRTIADSRKHQPSRVPPTPFSSDGGGGKSRAFDAIGERIGKGIDPPRVRRAHRPTTHVVQRGLESKISTSIQAHVLRKTTSAWKSRCSWGHARLAMQASERIGTPGRIHAEEIHAEPTARSFGGRRNGQAHKPT